VDSTHGDYLKSCHSVRKPGQPRRRTKVGAAPKHREPNSTAEAVRRRRSTANRGLTILKTALNGVPYRIRTGVAAVRETQTRLRSSRDI